MVVIRGRAKIVVIRGKGGSHQGRGKDGGHQGKGKMVVIGKGLILFLTLGGSRLQKKFKVMGQNMKINIHIKRCAPKANFFRGLKNT